MALYTNDSKDRVREAVDFVELVSARTELRRAGAGRYEGLCPFHDERTPSFGIDPAQKVYYCFGCQAAGDVFTFVQETEGLDFKGALELLADRYGVELEREQEDPREAERRRKRASGCSSCSRARPPTTSAACGSRARRPGARVPGGQGLGEEILREFRVGYAPSAWDRVLLASRARRILRAGAVRDRPGAALQRERAALRPLPRADHVPARATSAGGCSASAPRGDAREARARPKYLNTSDNDVYHKGRHLYGADLARAARRAGRGGGPVRGLHRRDRPAPGGHAQRGRA